MYKLEIALNFYTHVQNTKIPRFVNNNGGDRKEVTTTDWVYLGTNIIVPDGYDAVLFAYRGHHTGAPSGVCISKSDTDMTASGLIAIHQPTDATYNSHCITTTVIVTAGTYYLWSKGLTGISSETMYAILFKR